MQQQAPSIVIVGGGHAGAALCGELAKAGLGPRVQLVCEEAEWPYQRPPLSKQFLRSPAEVLQPHRPPAWYGEQGITVHGGDAVVAIDRAGRAATLASGRRLRYDHLVLATGGRARRLPQLPEGLANVLALRQADDARRLRDWLVPGARLTVLGGGFIGLEVAATARALGLDVEVLESLPRLLSRALSAEMAESVRAAHAAAGIALHFGVRVDGFEIEDGRLVALQVDGARQPVDRLLLGIGAVPDMALAQAAGLAVDNGIVVDACMRSSDPAILAIGDCTSFPSAAEGGRRLRLESVQNATDQASIAAATLQGREEPYRALPWFWSDQGALRLQMAGLMPAVEQAVRHRRPAPSGDGYSLLHYVGERFVCIESLNAALDHTMARKLLEAGRSPPPAQACDPAVPLKGLLAG